MSIGSGAERLAGGWPAWSFMSEHAIVCLDPIRRDASALQQLRPLLVASRQELGELAVHGDIDNERAVAANLLAMVCATCSTPGCAAGNLAEAWS